MDTKDLPIYIYFLSRCKFSTLTILLITHHVVFTLSGTKEELITHHVVFTLSGTKEDVGIKHIILSVSRIEHTALRNCQVNH